MKKLHLVGYGFLILILILEGYANFELDTENTAVRNQYKELSVMYSQLMTSHSELTDSYGNLSEQHNVLEGEYQTLESSHSDLQTQYSVLSSGYESLQDDFYDLESEHDNYVTAYQNLRTQVNFHSYHPSEKEKDFITPDNSAVSSKVRDITGGWSDKSDWDEYYSDIKKMYDWVVSNIEYQRDHFYPVLPSDPSNSMYLHTDMWQTPAQTLELEKGDCEDMAILLTSMIRCYNDGKYWVECIYITGHVALYLPVVGGEVCILDPAGRYSTNYGSPSYSLASRDIRTEVTAWLSQWDAWYPEDAPHKVVRVFSSYLWTEFSSTSEYIDWMYSRTE